MKRDPATSQQRTLLVDPERAQSFTEDEVEKINKEYAELEATLEKILQNKPSSNTESGPHVPLEIMDAYGEGLYDSSVFSIKEKEHFQTCRACRHALDYYEKERTANQENTA